MTKRIVINLNDIHPVFPMTFLFVVHQNYYFQNNFIANSKKRTDKPNRKCQHNRFPTNPIITRSKLHGGVNMLSFVENPQLSLVAISVQC